MPSAKREITLYQGEITVQNQLFSARGGGRISFRWNPRKQTIFEVKVPFIHEKMLGEGVEVVTKTFSKGVPGQLLYLEDSFKDGSITTKVVGLLGPLGIGYGLNSPESESVIFHLANLENSGGADFISMADGGSLAGRHVLRTDDWLVTLDSRGTKIPEELERYGGFCITQICKLERLDGTIFGAESAQNVLEALSYFLSF